MNNSPAFERTLALLVGILGFAAPLAVPPAATCSEQSRLRLPPPRPRPRRGRCPRSGHCWFVTARESR